MTTDPRLRFAPTAVNYVRSAIHAQGDDLPKLAALAERLQPALVLDVATGGGHTALAVAPHARHVIAYDLTREMLQAAREYIAARGAPNVVLVEGDAAHLPFASGAFDLVTCRVASHHFADVPAFCREAARVLRRSGSLAIVDILGHEDATFDEFLHDIEVRRDPSHVRNLPPSAWRRILREAGFSVSTIETFRRLHDYEDWMERQHVPPNTRVEIARDMLAAPPSVREHYRIEPGGPSGVESFETDLGLVLAVRN
ncbi:MAG TPA: class I SAM-dependent methyltransferase [Dehalococcoidia bacterium]|nr:class I SAM-dependent methyltransferase [Dehalococcoidia bacterium]